MTKAVLTLFLLTISLHAASISLKITGITQVKGLMRVVLFANEQDYNEQKNQVAWKIVKVEDTVMTLYFDSLPEGRFAIKVFQDLNKNSKLDSNMFGPKEPYGFSNNSRHKLRGATFAEAAFDVKDEESIEIRIK